jgi:uncharacterized protein (TIRG00374 family)
MTSVVLRAILGLALGLLVASGVGWLLGVDPGRVVKSLRSVPWWVVAGCAASAFVVFALQAVRWSLVMKPLLGLGYWQAYRALVVGAMFNAFLPARGGDLLRVQYLGRRTGKSKATILGTELIDRWLDWSGWFPILIALSLSGKLPRWLYVALGTMSVLLLGWAIAMVILGRRRNVPRQATRFADMFAALRLGFGAFESKRILFIGLVLAPLPWLWETSVLTLLGRAFGTELSLGMAFSVLIAFNVATVVPTPGSIGTWEAAGTAALVALGMDQSKALAYMVVYHFTQLLPAIAAGATILTVQSEHFIGQRDTSAK